MRSIPRWPTGHSGTCKVGGSVFRGSLTRNVACILTASCLSVVRSWNKYHRTVASAKRGNYQTNAWKMGIFWWRAVSGLASWQGHKYDHARYSCLVVGAQNTKRRCRKLIWLLFSSETKPQMQDEGLMPALIDSTTQRSASKRRKRESSPDLDTEPEGKFIHKAMPPSDQLKRDFH